MASLPSFVQLMASLGLSDPKEPSADPQHSDSNIKSVRSRSVSSPPSRQYSSRYSPYSPSVPTHRRNGSLSSTSSLSDAESSPKDQTFCRSSPLRTRKYRHKVSRSDSSSDIAGDTPISTYVRRKTPCSSPASPSFDSGYESLGQTPFSIPALPVLLPKSASSDPESPSSDCDDHIGKDQDYYRLILRQRTGTRISAARAARREQIARRYALQN